MGQERFFLVKPCAQNDSAMIIEDVQERGLPVLAAKPAVRRSIILPKLAYFLGLPTANGLTSVFGFLSCQTLSYREAAQGRAMGLEVEAAEQLRSNRTVGAMVFEEVSSGGLNLFGPRLAAIAAGGAGTPEPSFSLSDRLEIGTIKGVETAGAETQFGCALGGSQLAGTKSDKDVPNVRSAKTFEQLSKLFTPSE